jgi:prepilin-type N-terminal cleavage/methylation domain-containing protein
MYSRTTHDARGFSFIELMIAMAILAMGMLAAVSMHLGSTRNNTKGNIYTQANMLAKSQLETLKNQDVLNLTAGGPYQDPNNPVDSEGQPGGIYTRSWTIDTLGTDARRITVMVQWNRQGRPGTVTVSSNTKGGGV